MICLMTSLVNEYPPGYPRLAALVALDRDYLIIRQFNYLRVRVLLNLQDKLQRYEENLEQFDECRYNEGQPIGEDHDPQSIEEIDLLRNIEKTLTRYSKLRNDILRVPSRA